jgi:hypothetical protein
VRPTIPCNARTTFHADATRNGALMLETARVPRKYF